ncbi:MAG: cation-translocating P-type ATPase [Ruminococcaceae bacterium]|nr:cation-translocating P-type ATPase [Oscillospiraceae bacterium]
MKKINNMVENSVKEYSQNYISDKDKSKLKKDIKEAVFAIVFLLSGFIYGKVFPNQEVIQGSIYLIGVAIIGIPVFVTAVKGFLQKDINSSMEILVSIAILVSVLDGQYILAGLIPIILTLVHFLEEKSIMGGRDAIEGLKKLQADTAIVLVDGDEKEVDAKTLKTGDLILVKPGMSLPIDGIVKSGISNMDQKSLTGEALPKEVKQGDTVYAGTTNIDGLLTVEVTKAYSDTSFQKIVELLEGAEKMTVPETQIVDKFMTYYLPIVLVVAVLMWLFTKDISKAIAILVVSCPCGYMLVSSAPIIAALASATKRGILIKNPSFIEKLTDVNYFVFDKTGTITNGTLEAVDFHLVNAETNEELIKTAASVAHGSLHPTSKSIMTLVNDEDYDKDFEITEIVGNGVKGAKNDDEVIVGNSRYIKSLGFELPEDISTEGTLSWVVKNKDVLGAIIFRDVLRHDAHETIEKLRTLGVNTIAVLTGDNTSEAKRVMAEANIDVMHTELLPEQKLEKVKEAQKNNLVAVVGDGINDSLALSEADVGIAMGAMGSDTAIQSADISLMNNSLDNLPFVIELSRKTKATIYQNIIIAFSISFVMMVLAATGLVTPLVGAFLHNIGAFIILINSGKITKKK